MDLNRAKTKGEFSNGAIPLVVSFAGVIRRPSSYCPWLAYQIGVQAPSQIFTWGKAVLKGTGRGGRYYQNLNLEEKQTITSKVIGLVRKGGILEVSRVKAAYKQVLGRKVPKSNIYRMLARHGWRQVVPRPRYPKSDAATQAEVKKTAEDR
jgi:hypothetical protein